MLLQYNPTFGCLFPSQLSICTFNPAHISYVRSTDFLLKLTSYVDFLEKWSDNSHVTFTIVSGILPSAVSAFFSWCLPVVMRWLSRYQGAITRSRLDRAVVARYFAFLMISQLFIFTLIGVIFRTYSKPRDTSSQC